MSSGNVNLLVPDDERGRTESLIAAICNDIRDLLLAKNRAYGNSALNLLGYLVKLMPENNS